MCHYNARGRQTRHDCALRVSLSVNQPTLSLPLSLRPLPPHPFSVALITGSRYRGVWRAPRQALGGLPNTFRDIVLILTNTALSPRSIAGRGKLIYRPPSSIRRAAPWGSFSTGVNCIRAACCFKWCLWFRLICGAAVPESLRGSERPSKACEAFSASVASVDLHFI